LRGEGERAPSYLVSPLGAKINRVFVSGVITEVENTGTDTDPRWRARMSDPTGIFYISAGQFQPEAAEALSKIKTPVFASVIGKVRTYKPESGVLYISIRPEIVKEIDNSQRDAWVLETCRLMKSRLGAMKEAVEMDPFSREALLDLGYMPMIVDGVSLAMDHYKGVDIDRYERMLVEALRYLLPEYGDRAIDRAAWAPRSDGSGWKDEGATRSLDEFDVEPEDQAKLEEIGVFDVQGEVTEEEKQQILKYVEELMEDAENELISFQDIIEKCVTEGIDKDRAEEILNLLQGEGELSEPSMGLLRRE
jgi:RPA family protein